MCSLFVYSTIIFGVFFFELIFYSTIWELKLSNTTINADSSMNLNLSKLNIFQKLTLVSFQCISFYYWATKDNLHTGFRKTLNKVQCGIEQGSEFRFAAIHLRVSVGWTALQACMRYSSQSRPENLMQNSVVPKTLHVPYSWEWPSRANTMNWIVQRE